MDFLMALLVKGLYNSKGQSVVIILITLVKVWGLKNCPNDSTLVLFTCIHLMSGGEGRIFAALL